MRRCLSQFVVLLVALTLAYALKRHYSTATAAQLGWILWPTAAIVAAVTETQFTREEHVGFVSTELNYAIVPSCAGVNFLIVVFVTLVLGLAKTQPSLGRKTWLFVLSLLVAYGATLVVNAMRICIALALRGPASSSSWLSPQQVHRVTGVIIYMPALLLIYFAARWLLLRRQLATSR